MKQLTIKSLIQSISIARLLRFLILLAVIGSRGSQPQARNVDTDYCNDHQDDKCICVLEDAIRSLTSSIRSQQDDKIRLKLIKAYHCFGRIELPDMLSIDATLEGLVWSWEDMDHQDATGVKASNKSSSTNINEEQFATGMEAIPQRPSIYRLFDRRLKIRKRIKRTIRLGIPSEENFQNAIANVSQNANHKYVILGAPVTLSCKISNSESGADNSEILKYSWTHNHYEPITAPMSKVNERTGVLEIPVTQFSDVGLYKCTAIYKNDESNSKPKTSQYQISVVSEPIFFVTYELFYKTERCNPHELDLIRDKIPEWIKYYISKYCEVHSIKVNCNMNEDSNQLIKLTMTVSAIGFQFTSSESSNLKKCEITCMESLHSKILAIMQDSVTKLFKRPIEVKGTNAKQRRVHQPEYSLTKIELFQECLPGFAINHKLCFPCKPGQFSQPKMTKCEPCHIGTYQTNPGSKECVKCPEGTTTVDDESTDASNCHSEIISDSVNFLNGLVPQKLIQGTKDDYYDEYTNILDNDKEGLGKLGEKVKYWKKYKTKIALIIGCALLVLLLLIILICIRCCCPYSGLGKVVSKLCCFCCPPARVKETTKEETTKKKDRKKSSKRR